MKQYIIFLMMLIYVNAAKNSCKKYMKFMSSKLPNRPKSAQFRFCIHNKRSQLQDFILRNLNPEGVLKGKQRQSLGILLDAMGLC